MDKSGELMAKKVDRIWEEEALPMVMSKIDGSSNFGAPFSPRSLDPRDPLPGTVTFNCLV